MQAQAFLVCLVVALVLGAEGTPKMRKRQESVSSVAASSVVSSVLTSSAMQAEQDEMVAAFNNAQDQCASSSSSLESQSYSQCVFFQIEEQLHTNEANPTLAAFLSGMASGLWAPCPGTLLSSSSIAKREIGLNTELAKKALSSSLSNPKYKRSNLQLKSAKAAKRSQQITFFDVYQAAVQNCNPILYGDFSLASGSSAAADPSMAFASCVYSECTKAMFPETPYVELGNWAAGFEQGHGAKCSTSVSSIAASSGSAVANTKRAFEPREKNVK